MAGGLLSIGATGISAADRSNSSKTDLTFDPNDDEELRRFIRNFDSIDEERKQEDILENILSQEQRNAVYEARAPHDYELKVTQQPVSNQVQPSANTQQSRYVYTVWGKSWANSVVFKHKHRITFLYDDYEVWDIDHDGWIEDIAYAYHDEGNQSKWIDKIWADGRYASFNSYRKRKITYYTGNVLSLYPYSKLMGDAWGRTQKMESKSDT